PIRSSGTATNMLLYNSTSGEVTYTTSIRPTVSKILNHVAGNTIYSSGVTTAIPNWSASYTASGGNVQITAYVTVNVTGSSNTTFYLLRNGVVIDTILWNNISGSINLHISMQPLFAIIANETGTNTYSISYNSPTLGINEDGTDYCLMT